MAGTPRIVAELGRPETPEETAERKFEAARRRRANQTVFNLLLALLACLGIVLILVLVVVRPEQPARDPVDWAKVAGEAQGAVDEPLATPVLPPDWTANAAELSTGPDGTTTWYIGFITPSRQFIGMRQGIGADEAWVANRLDGSTETGSEAIDGREWTVHDRRESDDAGNLAYALTTQDGSSRYVLYGTADDAEFRTLASSIAAGLPAGAESAQ